jgi:predicted transcriptional regulator
MSLDRETWIASARAVRIEDELARRGIKLNGKVERDGPCPKCGGDDRFSINIKKQVFNCRGCGVGGDVIDLVRHLDGVDFNQACETLAGGAPKANGKDHTAEAAREVCTATFPYTDEGGELLFMVGRIQYRKPDGSFVLKDDGKPKKKFSQKQPDPNRPGQWIKNVEGVRIVPYKLPELLEAIGSEHFIVIVEGEAKADLLWSWNVPATCCVGGAKKWWAEHAAFLRDADVVILPDNDEPGRDHADAVGASLQGIAKSVRLLELPGLAPKGDVIDWARQGGTVEQLHDLIAREAEPWMPSGTTSASGQTSKDNGNLFDAARLKQMQFNPIKFVVHDYIVEGLTLFAGKPKVGKSWLLLHAATAVAEGGYTLGNAQCEQGDVLYCALEDNQRRLQSRMTKLFGDSEWPARLNFACEMPRLAEGGIKFIKDWIESVKRPRLVIVDTLAMVRMPNRKDTSTYDADYSAVKELRDLALKYGIAIVLVHHLRKAEADDRFDTISGTLGLTGAPDSIMILARDSRGTTLHAKGRDLIEIEKAVKFDPGTCTWLILGEAGAIRKSAEREAIVKAMEEAGSEALTPNQIATQCGMKPVNVRKIVAKLLAEGVVVKTTYGKYTLAAAAKGARTAA